MTNRGSNFVKLRRNSRAEQECLPPRVCIPKGDSSQWSGLSANMFPFSTVATHSISQQIKPLRTFLSETKASKLLLNGQELFRHSSVTLPPLCLHFSGTLDLLEKILGAT